jgi:integrase
MSGKKRPRGFGSIRRLPSGHWQARYRDHTGGLHNKTFATKAEADEHLAEAQTDLVRGTWRNPRDGRVLLRDYAKEWLLRDIAKAPTTKARDEAVLSKHFLPSFGGLALSEISPADIQNVIAGMSSTLAPKTVRTNAGVLQAVLNAAVKDGYLYVSPYRSPKLPPVDLKESRRLTLDEQRQLGEAMPSEYQVMVFLGGVLGLRWSEVVGLRVEDIDFLSRPAVLRIEQPIVEVSGRHMVSRGKTPGSRTRLTVPSFLMELIAEHLARLGRTNPEDLIVQAPRGGPLRAVNFRKRVWEPAIEVCGFNGLTFHGLRHSAAGLMRQAGASDQVVQHRMRHTYRSTTTNIYSWTPDAMDKLAVDAIDEHWHQPDGTTMARDGREER